jgi:hypothetical protein
MVTIPSKRARSERDLGETFAKTRPQGDGNKQAEARKMATRQMRGGHLADACALSTGYKLF